jgi:hypothetical protein
MLIAIELGYLDRATYDDLESLSNEVSKMLYSLMRKL